MELWRYLWISVIHAILKLQSLKNLELLIPCFSRAISKFVEASVGAMDNVSPPHLFFSFLIGLKVSTYLAQNMKSGSCTIILDSPLNVGIYIFPLMWADRSVLFHHMECRLTEVTCAHQIMLTVRNTRPPRPRHMSWVQSVHTSWDITGLCVRSSTQHKSRIQKKSLITLT